LLTREKREREVWTSDEIPPRKGGAIRNAKGQKQNDGTGTRRVAPSKKTARKKVGKLQTIPLAT